MFYYSRIRAAIVATFLATSVLCPGSKALAVVVTQMSDITSWYGTGSNEAALVIQWNDSNTPVSLAWGFRWDGVATLSVQQMLNAIAGQVTIYAPDPDDTSEIPAIIPTTTTNPSGDSRLSWTGNESASWGTSMEGISYNQTGLPGYTSVTREQSGFTNAGYWNFLIGTTGDSFNAFFAFADEGISSLTLTDGGWYGFAYAPYVPTATGYTFDAPTAAVPEPGTVLLALGGVAFLIIIRRRHAQKDARLLAH
jgi:hypothetical protein